MSKDLTTWLDNLLDELQGIEVRRKSSRRLRVDVAADALPALLELLRGRASYVHLSAITCVDWIDEGQFELVYHVWSYEMQSLVSPIPASRGSPGSISPCTTSIRLRPSSNGTSTRCSESCSRAART